MAPVTIVEFSDFQCPHCAAANPELHRIVRENEGRVKLVFKHYPLPSHTRAEPAARAAEAAARQGKFWEMVDLLFTRQHAFEDADLEKYAEQVGGINTAKLKAALDTDKHKSAVQADIDAVNKAGARIGTPSFFINGKLLQGAQPFPAFKTAIDDALAGK